MFDSVMNAAVSQSRREMFAPPPATQPVRSCAAPWQVPELVSALDASASWADCNLWLIRALQWLTQDGPPRAAAATALPVLRLRHLLNVLEREPAARVQVAALLGRLWREGGAAGLLTDAGHRCRPGLLAALAGWLRELVLPAPLDRGDLTTLCCAVAREGIDLRWIAELDAATLARLSRLCRESLPRDGEAQAPLIRAMHWLCTAIGAAVLAPGLRERVDSQAHGLRAFERLPSALSALLNARAQSDPAWVQAANQLRGLLQTCRSAVDAAREDLRMHGVSVGLLMDLEQVELRLDRLERLLDTVLSPTPSHDLAQLLVETVHSLRDQRSLRRMLGEHHRLLARKLAERHALAGEHYVARDAREYRALLGAACGGGGVVAFTTLAKFGIMGLAMAPFWSGLSAGAMYAASFIGIYLMHWTLATKQPAMTGPALTARLAEVQASHGGGSQRATEAFVDEIAALMRSQVAAVLGNLGMVVPVMLALQGLAVWWTGRPLLSDVAAHHVLEGLTLFGPTAFYAAVTGVILFAASLVGGWAENAFCFYQLQGALASHPGLVNRLGRGRAHRLALGLRRHVNGLTSNLALGLMLGLLPSVAGFLGLPLDVRHVTLSTGQLTAAVSTLGWPLLATPPFWACVAGIIAIGAINLGVSFVLACRMAMKARGVLVGDKQRLREALWRRWRDRPLSFLLPGRAP